MDSVSFFWSFFKMITTLVVVIAILIGVMYLLKKYFYRSPASVGNGTLIHIISSHSLGPKNHLMLVEVLGQVILLGVSDHQMSMLTTISNPEALEKLKGNTIQEGFPLMSDPFYRCKSLLRNIRQMRKEK